MQISKYLLRSTYPSVFLVFYIALSFSFIFAIEASSPDEENYEYGEELYDLSCSNCHGKNMINSGTSSFNLREFPTNQKQRFIESVSHGKGFMPSFGKIFDREEIEQLWIYISRNKD
jgi:mono/diheme cytochrome c family protein